jgi:hypothetical protein
VLGDGTTTANPHSIVAADLDGDDDCDLASANFANDTLTIFFQTSAGVFSSLPVTLSSAQAEMQDPRSLTAADLDGDGDLDLASANAASRTLAVFFQEGPGVYSRDPVVLRGTPTQMETPYFVVATDLDGDGDNDLATANRHGNSLTAFLQTRPGVFASFEKSFGAMLDGCDSLAAGDVDGDGDVDLVTASSLARAVQVYWCTD